MGRWATLPCASRLPEASSLGTESEGQREPACVGEAVVGNTSGLASRGSRRLPAGIP